MLLYVKTSGIFVGCEPASAFGCLNTAFLLIICLFIAQPLDSLYIRYAAGEAERLGFPLSGSGGAKPGVDEAKLFVGSLPKDVKEHEVTCWHCLFSRSKAVKNAVFWHSKEKYSRPQFCYGLFTQFLFAPASRAPGATAVEKCEIYSHV